MERLKYLSDSGDIKIYGKTKIVDHSMSPYIIPDNIDLILFDTTNGEVEAVLPKASLNRNRLIRASIVSGSDNAKLKF